MKLYRNWIINEVARAGEHTNERTYVRTYVRTYSHTYVRDRPYIPSTTLLCEGIIKVKEQKLGTVTSFKSLEAVVSDDGSKPEVLSRIAQVIAAHTKLKPI